MRQDPLAPESMQLLKRVSTATLTSELLNRGFRNTFIGGLQPLRPDLRMVGYAFTLRYVPAREDLDMQVHYDNTTNVQRLAVEAIDTDDVLVIDARGETQPRRSVTSSPRASCSAARLGSSPTVDCGIHPGFACSPCRPTSRRRTRRPLRLCITRWT